MSSSTEPGTDTGSGRSPVDRYIPGVPCYVDTSQPDLDRAAAFYGGLFGWRIEAQPTPEGAPPYLMASLDDGVAAGLGPATGGEATWTMYVRVADTDEAAGRVRDAGGRVLVEPTDVGDAGRMAVLADPSGAELALWQARRRPGSEQVNSPGGWNFNELTTADREGALAFYGAVFGWEASEPDESGASMWLMPGYGDHLSVVHDNPDLVKDYDEIGAPDRFADCVAWLLPSDAPGADRWGTTFGVADADQTAARAVELGGEVLQPVTDTGWTRTLVVRDPQGAVFTASQFTPPE